MGHMFYIGLYRENVKKSFCLKPLWYVVSSGEPLPSLFKLCPLGHKMGLPQGSHVSHRLISIGKT